MRFVAVIGLLFCAPTFAQQLDINGYSKVVVPRSQGAYFNANVVLREAARDAGFEVHESVEEIPRETWSKTLYMTGGVADFSRLTFAVVVYDVAKQTAIAHCVRKASEARRRRVSGQGIVDVIGKLVIQELVHDLGYQGFEQGAHDANLRVLQGIEAAGSEPSSAPAAPASASKPQMACRSPPSEAE